MVSQPPPPRPAPCPLPSGAVIRSHGTDCRGQISMQLLLTWALLCPAPERVERTFKKSKCFFKKRTLTQRPILTQYSIFLTEASSRQLRGRSVAIVI